MTWTGAKTVGGITVQNDKFVTIRGVSDRYNNVLINGAHFPVQSIIAGILVLILCPVNCVDGSVVVNKTASPDLPGEFTGGLVQIITKDITGGKLSFQSPGQGFNTASVNKQLISYKRDDKSLDG